MSFISKGSKSLAEAKLNNKVAPLIKREFKQNINDLVYNWTPSMYVRRKSGGLKQGIQHKVTVYEEPNGNKVAYLSVYNNAVPNKSVLKGKNYDYARQPGYLIKWIEGYSYDYKSDYNYTNRNRRSKVANLFVPANRMSKSRTPWLYARKPLTKTAQSVYKGGLKSKIKKIIQE